MTDITITINEQSLGIFVNVFIYLMIFLVIFMTIRLVFDMIENARKERWRRICQPYVNKYEQLKKEEKYEEALDFGKKYDKYLKSSYYYW